MHISVRHKKFWTIAICLLMGFILAQSPVSIAVAEETKEEKDRQRMLNREAVNALWRLKRALKDDAFYSGRVRLNVWRVAAIEAGKFDPQKYEEFKKQLYEKSVNDSLRCFEEFLLEEDFYNANFCLQTWRMHSKELGTYDQAEYEVFLKQMADAKAAKAARRAKEK